MLDSNQVDAWYNLGLLKEEDFTEYNNSVRNVDGFISPLQEYADEDFNEAEKYYLGALKIDSVNYQTILKLSLMFQDLLTRRIMPLMYMSRERTKMGMCRKSIGQFI